jgi:nucleoside-diphosphate-sugar epimerase
MQLCNGARVPTIKPITEHMEMNMAKTVWVLGANGRLGRAVALAFAAAGWRVRAPWRHGAVAQAPALPGVQWLAPGAALQAALDEGADAVVHAMNPARYTASAWRTEAPALLHQAITTALALRAVLLFPGNVYNFGAGMPAVLDAHTPQRPSTPLGQVRVALEQQLAQAVATQGLRAVIVRAGDFFGAGQGTWLDLVIARKLRQGVMTWPGPLDVPHAWAYLPDLAQAFVRVAAAPAPRAGAVALPAVCRSHHCRPRLADGVVRLGAGARLAARWRATGAIPALGLDAPGHSGGAHAALAAGHALPLAGAACARRHGAGPVRRPRAPHPAARGAACQPGLAGRRRAARHHTRYHPHFFRSMSMQRRPFLRILGGAAVLAATPALPGCSSALPAEALAAWQPPAPVPPGGDVRRWILAHAILAPHSHNLQSWLVDLQTPGEIWLYCDHTRLLPETDPHSRQILMSQGTFLELLHLAALQQGLRAEMELFPHGVFDPRTPPAPPHTHHATARVRLVPDASSQPDPLFAQVFRRHTNRSAYELRAPEAQAVQAIAAACAAPGLRADFALPGNARLPEHRAIARDAWRVELVTPRTMLESLKVLRVGPREIAQHRDGLSVNEPLPRLLAALDLFDRSRAPGPDDMAVTQQVQDFNAKIEATPAFFAMVTEGNDRATQVRAGRAYARAQLAATAHGLAMHPLQQALQEYPEQGAPLRRHPRAAGRSARA